MSPTKESLETVLSLNWDESKQYVLKSCPSKIYHALASTRRMWYADKVVAPGTVFVVSEGDFKSLAPDIYAPDDFLKRFRKVKSEDADAPVPIPQQEEIEAYEPKLSEPQKEGLEWAFTYHKPSAEQQENLVKVRAAARQLGAVILGCVPAGKERTYAMKKVRESVMWGNAGIVLEKPKEGES